jgi:hypothetical protein
MTAMWLGALRQGEALERRHGDGSRAAEFRAKAERARDSIRKQCWVPEKGLYADDGDRAVFSQHMNVFAVLYDIATPREALGILERITARGRGIEAPAGMYSPTYYFAWYLVRAFEHAGLAERYFELLQSWRDLLAFNYTTWPETRDQPRSDTHAWSAHPTADLLRIVAGIRSGADGYARVRIEPTLGSLNMLDATAVTPSGPVKVSYLISGDKLIAVIDRPAVLTGTFVWRGKAHELKGVHTRLELALKD